MKKSIEEIKLLTPFYERIVTVVPFMKTYYLKKDYHIYSNFFLSKIFYKLSKLYSPLYLLINQKNRKRQSSYA